MRYLIQTQAHEAVSPEERSHSERWDNSTKASRLLGGAQLCPTPAPSRHLTKEGGGWAGQEHPSTAPCLRNHVINTVDDLWKDHRGLPRVPGHSRQERLSRDHCGPSRDCAGERQRIRRKGEWRRGKEETDRKLLGSGLGNAIINILNGVPTP